MLRPSNHEPSLINIMFIVVGFAAGFLANHFLNLVLPPLPPLPMSVSTPVISQQMQQGSTLDSDCAYCPSIFQGIYPLLKDFQCGHENMATPRALQLQKMPNGGRGRIVVDVGLFSGEETLDAVEAGFVVFGF